MIKKLLVLLFLVNAFCMKAQNKFEEDFNYFWRAIQIEYAYFDQKQTDWEKVKEVYFKRLEAIKEDWEFTYLIELMKHELYDPHMGLNKNLPFSFRLIPNDLDAYISEKNNTYFIEDIREDYAITNSNLKIGDEVVAVNDEEMNVLLKRNLPVSIVNPDQNVKEYFANLIFAGRHDKPRKITVNRNGKQIIVHLEKATPKENSPNLIDYKVLKNNIGYIKINNSLGNNNVIKEFPNTVDTLQATNAIVIDLRATHSGGNAEVAKAIMGKFIDKEMPYQIHERVGLEREFGIKRKYVEILTPLKNPYKKPIYILVSRWTGSVGEAIAQGFSNIKTATVVGTTMAKLAGAITCRRLPYSKLNVCYPFEKLYNVDGVPREKFIPAIKTNNFKETYTKALQLINE